MTDKHVSGSDICLLSISTDYVPLIYDRVDVERGWLKLPMRMTFLQGWYLAPFLSLVHEEQITVTVYQMIGHSTTQSWLTVFLLSRGMIAKSLFFCQCSCFY